MAGGDGTRRLVGQYTASKELLNEFAGAGDDDTDLMASKAKGAQIADRETDYQKRRFQRQLTPTRKDAFKEDGEGRSYREVMQEKEIEREEERVRRKIEEATKTEKENGDDRMEGVEYRASLKESDQEAATDGTRKRVCAVSAVSFSLYNLADNPAEETMGYSWRRQCCSNQGRRRQKASSKQMGHRSCPRCNTRGKALSMGSSPLSHCCHSYRKSGTCDSHAPICFCYPCSSHASYFWTWRQECASI